jgi:hypothetical protein
MKSLETQLAELKEKYVAAETKKGFSKAAINTAWGDSVLKGATVEEKLSNAKELTAKIVTESVKKIRRNNGSAITESTVNNEQRIREVAKKFRMSIREAAVYCGHKDPGPNPKQSAEMTESLFQQWRKYSSLISESDCRTLAERGIEP